MAMRVRHTVVPIKSPADTARGRSRAQPPKAVAQRASLEPARAGSDHQKPKRRLTAKTVALHSAKGAALGTDYFSIVGVGMSGHRVGARSYPPPRWKNDRIAKAPPLLGVQGAKPLGGAAG